MTELQACYFCGRPDEVTEYAVVPPRFVEDDADQRTAALCEQCKEKLLGVIEPLATRLDETGTASEDGVSGEASFAGEAGEAAGSPSTATSSSPEDADDGVTIDPPGASESEPDPTVDLESPAGEAADEPSDASQEVPPNYRKAMRLLSNREFPMERYDVEELLGGAYAMENEEIAAVLAYAEESGRLEEEDGTLRRA